MLPFEPAARLWHPPSSETESPGMKPSQPYAQYDALPVMVWTSGPGGETEYTNACRLAFTGRRVEDEMGWGWVERVHPDDRAAAVEARRRASADGHDYSVEYRLRRQDGEYRWIEDTAVVRRGPSGEFAGLVGCGADVTARHEVEQRVRQMDRTEALAQLARGIAHDFNNLLTGIIGHVGLLLEDPALSEESRRDALQIQHAADRAAGLTGQLLAFSRRQTLAPRSLDLDRLVTGTVTAIRSIAGSRIEVVHALEPELEPVLADPGQLEEMLLRLGTAAREAMPHGGRLELRTGRARVDEALASATSGLRPGAYVTLTVRGSGPVLDREPLARLFEPLAAVSERPLPGGIAADLSAHAIARQSGGYVAFDHEAGAVFTVYLPRLEAAAEPAEAALDEMTGTETVLLVEDEAQVRELSQRVLERAGYTVLAAGDAEAAIAIADRHPGHIHLLVTDIVLPRVSGRELAARLGIHRPAIKVLFVSGTTDGSLARHRMLEPGTAFLEKPFSLDRLLRAVRRALGAPEAFARSG